MADKLAVAGATKDDVKASPFVSTTPSRIGPPTSRIAPAPPRIATTARPQAVKSSRPQPRASPTPDREAYKPDDTDDEHVGGNRQADQNCGDGVREWG